MYFTAYNSTLLPTPRVLRQEAWPKDTPLEERFSLVSVCGKGMGGGWTGYSLQHQAAKVQNRGALVSL